MALNFKLIISCLFCMEMYFYYFSKNDTFFIEPIKIPEEMEMSNQEDLLPTVYRERKSILKETCKKHKQKIGLHKFFQ